MGNKLIWQEHFNTGIDFMDEEHKKLFTIINRLLVLSETPSAKSQWACREGIKYFKTYTMHHFEEEEAYMVSINYSGYTLHKRLHDNFRHQTLPALEKELEETDYSFEAVRHCLGVCIGWLTGHTLTEDHAIVGKAESKWKKLAPQENLENLEQTINHLVNDMFKLDTRLVNVHYSGEDFGSVFCYRIIYSSGQNGDRHEFILVFEEKLIVRLTGEMLGIRFREMNDIVINSARYLAQQFLDGISKSFPSKALYDIEMESLLTRGQLHEIFQEKYPEYSLLFDTGEGYFAFCLIPYTSHGEIGCRINAENAMDQIRKYLNRNDAKRKNKILVVDDSSLIQLSMKKLLEADYEVRTVNSGMAALNDISEDKPDLILLDYEMPVHDGRRTLEMIRARKEVADIPVIFLTGRCDKESIMKVLDLNPAGYMLKTLHSSDIKKNIDYFFEKKRNASKTAQSK